MHQRSLGRLVGKTSSRAPQLCRCTVQQFHTSQSWEAYSDSSSPSTQSSTPRTKSSASADAFRRVQGLNQSTSGNGQFIRRVNDTSDTRGNRPFQARRVNDSTNRGSPARVPFTRGGGAPQRGTRGDGARGGIGARGGRGGRGGLNAKRPTRSRRPRAASAANADLDDGGIDDLPLPSATNYGVLTDEDHREFFDSEQEVFNYTQLADFVDEYVNIETKIERLVKEAKALQEGSQQQKQVIEEIGGLRTSGDEGLKEALDFLVASENEAMPFHDPTDVSNSEFDSEIGGIPIGQTGTGNVIEESLRYVAGRPNQEWRDPQVLAKKLIDGEFMKFRDQTEKRKVLKIAEQFAYKADAPKGTVQVGFESPSDAMRKIIVQRLVQGKYVDPSNYPADVRGKSLKSAFRIVGANASYGAAKSQVMMKTIREMMPPQQQRGAGGSDGKEANA